MGMYTEIFFRAEIKNDLSPEERNAIDAVMGHYENWMTLPDHEFFKTNRWMGMARGDSAYFPTAVAPFFGFSGFGDRQVWSFNASLKNYNSEIEKFFDWVLTVVRMYSGDFLGYSLYEESENPTLYHVPED